jgi:tetratricopeptide (TPR) repeat protein
MAKKGKAKGAQARREVRAAPVPVAAPAPARRGWLIYAAIALLLAAAAVFFAVQRPDAPARPAAAEGPAPPPRAATAPQGPAAQYVGSKACASCHQAAYDAWQGSQHAAAMLPASAESVKGDFSGTTFAYGGVTSTFSRRDGRFYVRTDGPDGKLGDFEVKYAFGVEPLQQYLIELPGGRLQALGVAWDSRPKAAGGQRWFHLYPDRKLKAGDPLHWTGIDQNWNYQCADCHSTDLRKNYDAQSAAFKTTWAEVNVGCEACHGPGSNHVAWAKKEGDWQRVPDMGLAAKLDERRGVTWAFDAASGNAARSKPRETNREIEVCARCHARRGQFSDDHAAGQPFHDAFRPALLDPGLYYVDGQQRDEVYTYASFLQSRMHAKGVTCSDCHDPHSMKLRAPGNAVCAQCHAPAKFDVPAHHRHPPGTRGAECAACHMPTTTYMVVDPRHDHSMRIPRPDRTVSLGVPNACNACHRESTAQWAADWVRKWYGEPKPGFQTFAEALHAADQGPPGAQRALTALVRDGAQSPIARASALSRLPRYLSAATLPAVVYALNDPDPNVRMAAVQALGGADAQTRLRQLPRMLRDPVRVVRMDAARALAGEAEQRLAAADRAVFDQALAEYVAAQRFNADRPEAQTALGTLFLARGEIEDATAAYRAALKLDPTYVEAAVNLADLYRVRGLDAEGEAVLREVLQAAPQSAAAHHALGLALIRQKKVAEAVAALGRAAKLAPEDARFAYVYGVALHDTGKPAEAIKVLAESLKRHPYDRDILVALGTYEREAGRAEAARARAKVLRELEPDDPAWARAAAGLEAPR